MSADYSPDPYQTTDPNTGAYPEQGYDQTAYQYGPGSDPYAQGGEVYDQAGVGQPYTQDSYSGDQQYDNYDYSQTQNYPQDATANYQPEYPVAQKTKKKKKRSFLSLLLIFLLIIVVSALALEMGIVKGGENLKLSAILGLGDGETGFAQCETDGGTITETSYPFYCTDSDGNIFFKDSTTSEQTEEAEKYLIQQATSGFISLQPKNAKDFSKNVIGVNDNQIQQGLTIYTKADSDKRYKYEMVVNNTNLPNLTTEQINLLEKTENFITSGDGYENGENPSNTTPQIIDAFNYQSLYAQYYSYYLGEITDITYANVDSYRMVYTFDANVDNMKFNAREVTVKVFAKKGDDYILLEKAFETADIKKVEKDYVDDCFINSARAGDDDYEDERECYLEAIREDTDIPTQAKTIAQELIQVFEL